MIDSKIEVVGVKEALRELNSIDKRARRQITSDYREIMRPVTTDAKSLVPTKAPLSGFDRNWTPKGASKSVLPFERTPRTPRRPSTAELARSRESRRQMGAWLQWQQGINTYVSGKRPQTIGGYTRNLSAFGVRWLGPAAVLFDTSGQSKTPQGAKMVAALTGRFGSPSRVMWRAWSKSGNEVQDNVQKLIERVMLLVGQKIKVGQ